MPRAVLRGVPAGTRVAVKVLGAEGMEGWDVAAVVKHDAERAAREKRQHRRLKGADAAPSALGDMPADDEHGDREERDRDELGDAVHVPHEQQLRTGAEQTDGQQRQQAEADRRERVGVRVELHYHHGEGDRASGPTKLPDRVARRQSAATQDLISHASGAAVAHIRRTRRSAR